MKLNYVICDHISSETVVVNVKDNNSHDATILVIVSHW